MLTLELADVSKKYKVDSWAVSHVSATMKAGLLTLIGPNGAGKTTLLRLLAGILEPSSGRVLLNRKDIHQNGSQYKQKLGYLPQEFDFYPDMTGREFLHYMARLKGIPSSLYPLRVEDVAQCVGVAPFLEQKIEGWSAGLKRRLGIAQALLNDPDILILDEPMVGLDPEEKLLFGNYFLRLSRERIVIASSNILSEFIMFTDRVLLLVKGEVHFDGRIDQLLNLVDGKVWTAHVPVEKGQVLAKIWAVSGMHNTDCGCQIRIVSDIMPSIMGMQPAVPCIEDAYTYIVRRNDSFKKG